MVQLALLNYGPVLGMDFEEAVYAVQGLKRKNFSAESVLSDTLEGTRKMAVRCAKEFGEYTLVDNVGALDSFSDPRNDKIVHPDNVELLVGLTSSGLDQLEGYGRRVLLLVGGLTSYATAVMLGVTEAAELKPYHGFIFDFPEDSWEEVGKPSDVEPFSSRSWGYGLNQP